MTYHDRHDRDIHISVEAQGDLSLLPNLALGESAHLGIAVFLGALSKHLDANHVKACLGLTYCH